MERHAVYNLDELIEYILVTKYNKIKNEEIGLFRLDGFYHDFLKHGVHKVDIHFRFDLNEFFKKVSKKINAEMVIKINIPYSHFTFYKCHFYDFIDYASTEASTKLTFYYCKFPKWFKLIPSKIEISLIDCEINKLLCNNFVFENIEKDKKRELTILRNNIEDANFENTIFKVPVNFYGTIFQNSPKFKNTQFLDIVNFSRVVFKQNVLFRYTHFTTVNIFGNTVFKKGFDFSQSIISGDLYLFDFKIDIKSFKAEYGEEKKDSIMQHNKVATFQTLKEQFANKGNHIEALLMRRYENESYAELFQSRRKDPNWKDSTLGDRVLLWLNKYSNNYGSDFKRGILFTLTVALIFFSLTFFTSGEFWNRICFSCSIDWDVVGYTVKQFVNFLNPVHKTNYIDELNPVLGIPYIFDFLGRIFVGYGIYQTIQAFRKYK